ncbi:MAG: bile acid:sodium symporter family protein [Myxococcota bacterium]|nr:bile acid:sodium symporter family protein [Myxococcota bacterium]
MENQDSVNAFLSFFVGSIMLAMGLGLTKTDFKRLYEKPKAAGIGLGCQLVGLPLLGFLTALIFQLEPYAAVGLILVTACPGGAHSNLYTSLARGDTALSVALTATSGIVTFLSIPWWLFLAMVVFVGGEQGVHGLPVRALLKDIVILMGLPIAIGMVLRAYLSKIAHFLEKVVKTVAVVMLLMIVVGAVVKDSSTVISMVSLVGLPVIFLNLSAIALGFGLARFVQLPHTQVATIALEVGIQNCTLAVGLAMKFLGADYIVVPVVYSLVVYFTGALLVAYGRRGASQSVLV